MKYKHILKVHLYGEVLIVILFSKEPQTNEELLKKLESMYSNHVTYRRYVENPKRVQIESNIEINKPVSIFCKYELELHKIIYKKIRKMILKTRKPSTWK
jgi:hypothetical protein